MTAFLKSSEPEIISGSVEQRIDPAASIFNLGRRNKIMDKVGINRWAVNVVENPFTENIINVMNGRFKERKRMAVISRRKSTLEI